MLTNYKYVRCVRPIVKWGGFGTDGWMDGCSILIYDKFIGVCKSEARPLTQNEYTPLI